MKHILSIFILIITLLFGKSTFSLTRAEQTFEFNQSTQQAFYFIQNVDGINMGDVLLAYREDVLVGFREWTGEITDVPVMGDDGSKYSADYMLLNELPTFKLFKNNEFIELTADNIPVWKNNAIYLIPNLFEEIHETIEQDSLKIKIITKEK